MAEGTYEYECMRAELLGIDKPDYEEFLKKQKERADIEAAEIEAENLKEIEAQGEELKVAAGKLDELNNILAATQKKIGKFKVRCGSVTELIKTKIGGISGGGNSEHQPTEKIDDDSAPKPEEPPTETPPNPETPRKSDLNKALDNHVDALDSLLDKAENAHYNMNNQNKQIRKLLE